MELSNKNPFSLYDFLGYTFPGAFALYIAAKVLEKIYGNIFLPDLFLLNINLSDKIVDNTLSTLVISTLLLISSYIIGHFISYLSSISIEKVTQWYYGFPSKYLLEKDRTCFKTMFWNSALPIDSLLASRECPSFWEKSPILGLIALFLKIIICMIISPIIFIISIFVPIDYNNLYHTNRSFILRIIVCLLVFPWSIGTLLIGHILNMDLYYIRPLDPVTIESLIRREDSLMKKLGIDKTTKKNNQKEFDIHRVIQHYEYDRNANHNIKMDNYVALYGFLRSVSFLFVLLSWALVFFIFYRNGTTKSYFLLTISSSMSYLAYMGFLKFYRRYTVENYMNLIADDDLEKKDVTFLFKSNESSTSNIVYDYDYDKKKTPNASWT